MAKNRDKNADEDVESTPKAEKDSKKNSGGGLGLPALLGIILGTLVVIIVAIRFLFLPYIVENLGGGPKVQTASGEHAQAVNKNWEAEFFAKNEKITQFFETGRITTNPKNSTQFVVVNLGIIYSPKNEDHLKELKEEKAKEAKESKEEAGGNPSLLPTKNYAKLKGAINMVLGSLSREELQARRDSLPVIFKEKLKPVFKEKEMFVKDVILQEFIIQE